MNGAAAMEFWDLYNDKREKTGRIHERGKAIPEGYYHLCVSVWLVNRKGEFLLSQRHPDKEYPLCWECTGGSVLAGESSLDGALREVKEELGITLAPEKGKILFQTRRDKRQDYYDVWIFPYDVDIENLRLQSTEVVAARWVNRETLLDLYQRGKLHPLLNYVEDPALLKDHIIY